MAMRSAPDGPAMRRDELNALIDRVVSETKAYLSGIDDAPVREPGFEEGIATLEGRLPEQGDGAMPALDALIRGVRAGAVASSGPRYFHFVMGGVTPASLAGDWLTTVFDQVGYAWASSPLAVRIELVVLDWLKHLFELPERHEGVMTTGATMANFVGLAAARQWWGKQHGRDVGQEGLGGLAAVPVFSSGYVHASAVKALSMLGVGRSAVRRLAKDAVGRLDVDALERELVALDGAPAIVIGNAGEVNAGDFDPLADMAALTRRYNAWFHVDGAFGLFANLSDRTRQLTRGVDSANSITVDGHKWLNVPYDCGFAFVDDPSLLQETFAYSAEYLQAPDDPRPNFGVRGPESSRRARAIAAWATLRAYGRRGYRDMVEGHLDLARYLAECVDASTDLERLAAVPLNIVCFRFNPGGLDEDELNRLNASLGETVLSDGRVFVGTTRYDGRVALRPAIVNWRTRERDIDVFVDVVRELGHRLHQQHG